MIKQNPADQYNAKKKRTAVASEALRSPACFARTEDERLLTKEQKAALQKENPTKIESPVIKENSADTYNMRKKEEKLQAGLKKSGMLRRDTDGE